MNGFVLCLIYSTQLKNVRTENSKCKQMKDRGNHLVTMLSNVKPSSCAFESQENWMLLNPHISTEKNLTPFLDYVIAISVPILILNFIPPAIPLYPARSSSCEVVKFHLTASMSYGRNTCIKINETSMSYGQWVFLINNGYNSNTLINQY